MLSPLRHLAAKESPLIYSSLVKRKSSYRKPKTWNQPTLKCIVWLNWSCVYPNKPYFIIASRQWWRQKSSSYLKLAIKELVREKWLLFNCCSEDCTQSRHRWRCQQDYTHEIQLDFRFKIHLPRRYVKTCREPFIHSTYYPFGETASASCRRW